ncbi:MAG: fused MFS/spermidine synthase [Deltaproteobacteria bacterium]|nr:fused MFS/spermidine synthase [Deltaproteobacteria bacterium]
MDGARARPEGGGQRARILLAVLCSGLAGLMHEVIASKLLAPLVGASAHAQAVVLGTFMLGLALGAVFFGRRVDRSARPLRLFLALELGVALYALLLPLLVGLAGAAYVALAGAAGIAEASVALRLLPRLLLASVLLLPPTFLMGGTLPVLSRHLVGSAGGTRRTVGGLYALNSLGAVLGAGLAGLWALPALGVQGALFLTAGLNLLAAALVFGLRGEQPASGGGEEEEPPPAAAAPLEARRRRAALLALGASGFVALFAELVFLRIFALAFGSSTFSFTVMLMCFVAGISLGAGLVTRLAVRDPFRVFGIGQLVLVLSLLAAAPAVSRLGYWGGLARIALGESAAGFELFQLFEAALGLGLLLVPTACLGLTFPLVSGILVRRVEGAGRGVGLAYAWNTGGNLLGVALGSLVLLPGLGLGGSYHLILVVAALTGAALLGLSSVGTPGKLAALALLLAGGGLHLALDRDFADPLRLARGHLRLSEPVDPKAPAAERLRHPSTSFERWREHFVARPGTPDVVFLEEDAHQVVLVSERAGNRTLFLNTKPDASSHVDLDTQLLLAHGPLFLHPGARRVMVIGHGSGVTAGAALLHPVEAVEIVEISPAVIRADAAFAGANGGVLSDPRVRVVIDDAQSHLRLGEERYDLVISEPTNPWVAGVAALFTRDFFEAVRARLAPGGAFALWLQTYEQSDENAALVLRTLAAVFPRIEVFVDHDLSNLVVIGSAEPLRPTAAELEASFARPGVAADLARMQLPGLLAFLSHHRLSTGELAALLPEGPINTLGRERLEWDAPRRQFQQESSTLFERLDPLLAGRRATPELLLDRYLAARAAQGRPLSFEEVERTLGYARRLPAQHRPLSAALAARLR